MTQNIVEKLREESVKRLFATPGFIAVWPTWKTIIRSKATIPTAAQILNLGDYLKDIFFSTNTHNRSQGEVSGGGANWEALVCWYLNICNIRRRTVCIKHHKSLIPIPISHSITVNYGNFASNTESDLIAITFPDKPEYSMDKNEITIHDENGQVITLNANGSNYLDVLNALVTRDFHDIEIHIIQCKTNWNDNAQIPMLWDMIYSSTAFRADISIGREGYNINNAKRFSYAFATVPTVKLEKINPSSVCVSRVRHISGGNYWGLPNKDGVAHSIREMLNRNLLTGSNIGHRDSLSECIPLLGSAFSYFNFPLSTENKQSK